MQFEPPMETIDGSHSTNSTLPTAFLEPQSIALHQQPFEAMDALQHVAAKPPLPTEPAYDATVPIPDPLPPAWCTHTMRTRAVDGVFKPRTLTATKHPLPKVFRNVLAPSEPHVTPK